MVFSSFLPHPLSRLGTCTLSGLGFGNEIWELLSKPINIFYLLSSLTALCSVGAIPVHAASQKWLGKTWVSSYQKQSQLPRWKSVLSSQLLRVTVKAQQVPLTVRQWGSQGKLCTRQWTRPTTSSTRITVHHVKGEKSRFAFWQKCFPLGVPRLYPPLDDDTTIPLLSLYWISKMCLAIPPCFI